MGTFRVLYVLTMVVLSVFAAVIVLAFGVLVLCGLAVGLAATP